MSKKKTIEDIIRQKLREPRTIYLLGAGSSICAGLPGIDDMTKIVQYKLKGTDRMLYDQLVASLISNGIAAPAIEEILSELSNRLNSSNLPSSEKVEVENTLSQICKYIQEALFVEQPTLEHKEFLTRIVSRREAEPSHKAPPINIFTTNYDLLIELACEASNLVTINGCEGIFHRQWNLACFNLDIGRATTHTKTSRFKPSIRHVRLFKLHGSLSWFESNGEFYEEKPLKGSTKTPLIIYPSKLKYAQSIRPPFDWLFRKFGEEVYNAKLLVTIGYRFRDDNLNQYIFSGVSNGLSILVLSKEPIEAIVSLYNNLCVNVLNEQETIINGNTHTDKTDLWDFQRFSQWIPALN